MQTPSRHPTLTDSISLPTFQIGSLFTERQVRIMVGLLGFFTFMPYPALNFGNQSALQIGNFLTFVMCIPIAFTAWRGRPYPIYFALLAPLLLSMINVMVTGSGDPDFCMKSIVLRSVAGLTMLATQYYAPRYALELLIGIAWATILHVTLGAWQMYCFTKGEFPFAEWYINSSFFSVQNTTKIIANYIQRPFGMFPEPSAMSSSLAPILLIYIGRLCGVLRLKRKVSKFTEILFASAAAGGILLIIISRSGHTIVTLLAVTIFAVISFVRCRATPSTLITLLLVCCIVLPVMLWLGANAMSDRLGGKSEVGNSSWEERSSSLRVGFLLVTGGDLATLIFGIGPGLCGPIVYGVARLEAVWSVLLNYMYETGLIGSIAIAWLTRYLLRIWKSQQYSVAYISICFVWFVGVLLTTSYEQLLPIWIALGLFTVWSEVFELPVSKAAATGITADRAVPATAAAVATAAEPHASQATFRKNVFPAKLNSGHSMVNARWDHEG